MLLFFAFNFFIVAMSIAAKTARDAYFLSRYDRSILPLMFLLVAVGVAIMLTVYTRLAKRISQRQMFLYSTLLFISSLSVGQFFVRGWVIPILYVWVDVVVVIMVIQFWNFASESFEPRQAKRLFGLIGGGGSFAAMIVGVSLKPFVSAVGTSWLLVLASGFALIALVLGLGILSQTAAQQKIKPPRSQTGLAGKRHKMDPFLRGIAVVIAFSAIVTTIVDYQFKIIASNTFPNEGDLVSFFGNFYALTGFASLFMQFFLTGPILSRFGILMGLLTLPLMLTLGVVAIFISPILLFATFAKFSDQTFKFTINSSSLELLWLPVPGEKRISFKPLISGTIKSSAEGLAGLVTFFIVKVVALQYLSILSLGVVVIWLATAIRLKRGYVKALMVAVEKRQLDFEALTLDVHDSAMVATLKKTLESTDPIQQLFALDLIDGLPLSAWAESLKKLFNQGNAEVRKRLLELTWDEPEILPDDSIIQTINDNPEVAVEAIAVAGKRNLQVLLPDLAAKLTHRDDRIKAAAAAAILELGNGPLEEARTILKQMLADSDEAVQIIALNLLVHNEEFLPRARVIEFLENESPAISETALTIAQIRRDETLIPAIVTNLDIPQTVLKARQVLKDYPPQKILAFFNQSLNQKDLSRKRRLGIIRALKEYPTDESISMLLTQLNLSDFLVYSEVIESLLTIARSHPLDEKTLKQLEDETRKVAKMLYQLNEFLRLLPKKDQNILLKDFLDTAIRQRIPTLTKLGILDVPDTPVETYIHTILSGDTAHLPFVLEFFENVLTKEERAIISPLIEPISLEERGQIGSRYFTDLPKSLMSELEQSVYSPNKWQSVIALDYLFRNEHWDRLKQLDWNLVPDSSANCELIFRYLKLNETPLDFIPTERFKLEDNLQAMYSTLEKTILLKTVNLFKTIPAENLSRISQIAEEVHFPADTPIFKEGDYGDSLFIVVEGTVKIHKGDMDLATLGKGNCLGEMALLDQEPRSADATTVEESILLKIAQEEFYEVLGSNTEIMQGIIKLLTGRLREANEKLLVN